MYYMNVRIYINQISILTGNLFNSQKLFEYGVMIVYNVQEGSLNYSNGSNNKSCTKLQWIIALHAQLLHLPKLFPEYEKITLTQCFPNFGFSIFMLLLSFFLCQRCSKINLSTFVSDLVWFSGPRHPTLGSTALNEELNLE